jgi:hypothetical protein
MQLRMRMFPPAHLLLRVFSLWMRSSPSWRALLPNSAPSHGLPSRPSKAPADTIAAWAGAAGWSSIGNTPVPVGFRLVIAGTERSGGRVLPSEVRPYAS